MIQSYLNHICLIVFALIGPIHLPAGGLQKIIHLETSQQIVLSYKCSIYCSPDLDSKKLGLLPIGSNLSILNNWENEKEERWVRISLNSNFFAKNTQQPHRGWIKI